MYEKALTMKQFSGMYTSGDGVNLNLKYATEAVNCDTRGGSLQPMTKGVSMGAVVVDGEPINKPIGTMMRLYRRFSETDNDVFVVVADGQVYYKLSTGWVKATLPAGHTITDNDMDFLSYEVNKEGSSSPTDVLLFTNNTDGMFCLYGDDWSISYVPIGITGYKLGAISRHYERIWGTNARDASKNLLPDTLVYSQAYDPFNWTDDAIIVADDAGELDIPTWDGDAFLALKNYGSYLLTFKRSSVWRVLGTNPEDYVIKEQFGGGLTLENSVAVDGYSVYMMGERGVMVYDGTEVRDFHHDVTKKIFERINADKVDCACAEFCKDTYYLALPLDGSAHNNAILEYNTQERSFNLRHGVSVTSFLRVFDTLYFTSATDPYVIYKLDGGDALPLKWVSSWQDLNAANVVKSGFLVYASPECSEPFDLTITVDTEKKSKTKVYHVANGKYKRIRLSNAGRRFRITFQTTTTKPWQMKAGVEIHMELDAD